MPEVRFHESAEDASLKFAVVVARYQGKWVFCKHRERATYECPGGHREKNEHIEDTARRELWEETGAIDFCLKQVCAYSVVRAGQEESFGMLYYADIFAFEALPALEIEKIELFESLPDQWTYPLIQPKLLERVRRMGFFEEA